MTFYDDDLSSLFFKIRVLDVFRKISYHPDDDVIIRPDDNICVKHNVVIQRDDNTCVKRNIIIKADDSRYFYGTFGLGDLLAVCKENTSTRVNFTKLVKVWDFSFKLIEYVHVPIILAVF